MISYAYLRVNGAMSRAFLVFSALLVAFAVLVINSVGDLPDKVAIHFDANSAPDQWVSRGQYDVLVFLFLIGLPLILFALMAGLPRLTRGKGLIPNNEYWFADERKRKTEIFLLQHSSWLGAMTAAVIYGTHLLVTRANELDPPKLATDRFLIMILVYTFGLAWWTTAYLRHFKKSTDA